MINKPHIKILLAILIFIVSAASYYYPVHKKGYPAGADYQNLIKARNFALAGTYKNESSTGVILSSKDAKSGAETGIINPLTPIIYGRIFKYFGFQINWPLFITIALFSFFNILVFLIGARLFSVSVGFTAGFVSAFMPLMAVGATMAGSYEWAMLFFGIALWLALDAKSGPLRGGWARIILASVFFALAALSRNAFAISFVPFAIMDLYLHKSFKRTLVFVLPFILIFGSTLSSYSWLGVPNGYTDTAHPPFEQVGHVFSDPYSYYFNKENYLVKNFPPGAKLNRVSVLFLNHFGYKVGIKDKILAYFSSAAFYGKEFFQITNFGGPVIIALMIAGLFALHKRNPLLLKLFVLWFLFWFGFLVLSVTGNWDHYLEVIIPILILAALGFTSLLNVIKERFNPAAFKFAVLVLFLLLIYQLEQSAFWRLHDTYRSSNMDAALILSDSIKKTDFDGIYAAGIHPDVAYAINYYTDKNIIYFNSETVEELINSGKLNEAFKIYNVKAAAGYSSTMSTAVKKTTNLPVFPWDKSGR